MEKIRLGIVDINGTIHSDNKGVPQQVKDGFKILHSNGVATTIATGRGLKRASELLGENWENIVSLGLPVSVENGGRLASQDGINLRYHKLRRVTTESALGVVSANLSEVKFVAYYPREPEQGAVLWTPNTESKAARAEFRKRHGRPAVAMNRSLRELAEKIETDQACMIIVNFHASGMEEAFNGSNMVVNGPELNILEQGINKGKGVEDISDITGIPLVDIFVAGNDHNDVPMLHLPIGKKLLVGNTVTENMPDMVRISTPEALGEYFAKN